MSHRLWPKDWAASPLALPGARSCSTEFENRRGDPSRAHDSERTAHEHGYGEVVQRDQGLRLHSAGRGGKDVFVHATALERAGMRGLREGQKITYELQTDQRTGKTSAVNLQSA